MLKMLNLGAFSTEIEVLEKTTSLPPHYLQYRKKVPFLLDPIPTLLYNSSMEWLQGLALSI
jgi:hypothetical protein